MALAFFNVVPSNIPMSDTTISLIFNIILLINKEPIFWGEIISLIVAKKAIKDTCITQ